MSADLSTLACGSIDRTKRIFDEIRSVFELRLPPPGLIQSPDQIKRMSQGEGLEVWMDGNFNGSTSSGPPLLSETQIDGRHLWVVRKDDVVHAEERCAFGSTLKSKVIKHTNLTGGDAAYSGGELIFLDVSTVVVNGCSGRYGPKSAVELKQLAKAFADTGYRVWSMGFDEETNRPTQFLGSRPELVQ